MKGSLALIGAGYWGKNLARNFHALGVLHAICDTNSQSLETLRSSYSEAQFTTDYATVLQNPRITRVAIASPASTHYQLAKQALLAGKDVYVEKPLCLDSHEAQELIEIAQEQHRILMVGHLLQYHPCVKRLQELVSAGELGKLQYIASHRLNLGKIRQEENVLWSFAPHDLSVILSLCGHRLPTEVRCAGSAYLSKDVADTVTATLKFEDHLSAHIYVSWLNPFKEQKLTVVGSTGMAVFDDTQSWEDKLLLYRNYLTLSHGQLPAPSKLPPEKASVSQSEPLLEECVHFIDCCQRRVKPRTDGHEGLRVLQVLQAAQSSMKDGGEAKNPQQRLHSFFAHPTAVVDAKAEIGEGTKIWHFSHVMYDAKLGPQCNLGQNVLVSPQCILGRNVKVQNNVSLYTGVMCEDDVFIGPSAVFTNVLNPRSAVNRRHEYCQTIVRRGATIGANATIICSVELGEYCFVGAGAVVTKNIKPYALVVGNPARQVGWMSRHGERLELPLESDIEVFAPCPATGHLYQLKNDQVTYLGTEAMCNR
jgi:UDP-2-acetamido-3-amino-2,3-dideoxy-glucuronate N-acetyltransferase